MRFDWIVQRGSRDMRAFRTKEAAEEFCKRLNKRFKATYTVRYALET